MQCSICSYRSAKFKFDQYQSNPNMLLIYILKFDVIQIIRFHQARLVNYIRSIENTRNKTKSNNNIRNGTGETYMNINFSLGR